MNLMQRATLKNETKRTTSEHTLTPAVQAGQAANGGAATLRSGCFSAWAGASRHP